MKLTATLPDKTVKTLLWIPDWDFNWQGQYFYKDFAALPAGTKLDVEIHFDNSAENPRNPASPPKEVRWGEQSEGVSGASESSVYEKPALCFRKALVGCRQEGAVGQLTIEVVVVEGDAAQAHRTNIHELNKMELCAKAESGVTIGERRKVLITILPQADKLSRLNMSQGIDGSLKVCRILLKGSHAPISAGFLTGLREK